MKDLSLGELLLGLTDLVQKRDAILSTSAIGVVYLPILKEILQTIEALPAALRAARPLVDELQEADDTFDTNVNTIWFTNETTIRNKNAPAERRSAAERIRESIVPALGITRASYKDESIFANEKRPLLKEREADLKLFTTDDGRTLYDAALDMCNAGDSLDGLQSARSTKEINEKDRSSAKALRTDAIGLLGRCRRGIADEVKYSKTLPKTLEAQIFSYLDELQQQKEEHLRQASAKKKKEAQPEATTKAGTGD